MPNPYDPGTTAIVAGTSQAIQNFGSIYAQAKLNRSTRKWNEKMFGIQRAQALEDWRMQNEYNHPSSQMARLREAGLNPNLVYGNGATTTADGLRSTPKPDWSPQAPNMGSVDAFFSYYDLAVKQAQVDNMRVQNTVLAQDAILKAVAVLNGTTDNETKRFDLSMKRELKENSLDMARETLRSKQIENQFQLDENERRQVTTSSNLMEAITRVVTARINNAKTEQETANLKQVLRNLQHEEAVKKLDADMAAKGIRPNDSFFVRTVIDLLSKYFKDDERRKVPRGYTPLTGDSTDSFGRPRN